jgi:molybdopterin-guanine dinucleotide biosynthesis protein A
MTVLPDTTGLVLDGGKASRLGGVHKAFLQVDGRPIAERTLEVYRSLFPRILVATSRPEAWHGMGVETVADPLQDAGPLAGITAALAVTSTPLLFAAAGDMPHLSRQVIARLVETARSHAGLAVVPVVDGRPEPLHAVYPSSAAQVAREALFSGVRKITDFVERAGVVWVEAAALAALPGADRTFFNVNRPDDLAP